jgi:hypothetical protein
LPHDEQLAELAKRIAMKIERPLRKA